MKIHPNSSQFTRDLADSLRRVCVCVPVQVIHWIHLKCNRIFRIQAFSFEASSYCPLLLRPVSPNEFRTNFERVLNQFVNRRQFAQIAMCIRTVLSVSPSVITISRLASKAVSQRGKHWEKQWRSSEPTKSAPVCRLANHLWGHHQSIRPVDETLCNRFANDLQSIHNPVHSRSVRKRVLGDFVRFRAISCDSRDYKAITVGWFLV